MEYRYEIPDSFYSLFRSSNREMYIEALLMINQEYEYHSYYLSKEACIDVLSEYFSQKKFNIKQEEDETESDLLETPANRVLNWLLKNGWLKKLEDYCAQVTNIIIPDYASVFLEAFEKLTNQEMEDTEVYIQNVHAILFSLRNDPNANAGLLKTAFYNTRKLNKSLQDMLHNMNRFFDSLLQQNFYGDLLKEHLEGYVEKIVRGKYHILKTSDNFYIYKSDIKQWIWEMKNDEHWLEALAVREQNNIHPFTEMLESIDHGFDMIEWRIANLDREHMKYVKATVVRMNYLLNQESSMRGMVVQILNEISKRQQPEADLKRVAEHMNLSQFETLTEKSLYRRRAPRKNFIANLQPQEEQQELSKEDILRFNQIHNRFSRSQIEEFLERNADSHGTIRITEASVKNQEDFEKLILAYDDAGKRNSKYQLLPSQGGDTDPGIVDNGRYRYPRLTFIRKEHI
ncbi:MAG: hypothetical protein HFI74_11350 [Lachnospiraceae bacterium]|jgi:hypothetical protein|nr:hypothetical protein [Lachnospiraceae bacterium]